MDFGNVRTGSKRLVIAGDDNRADGVIRFEGFQSRRHFVHQFIVQRVMHLRPVEPDEGHGFVLFKQYVAVLHNHLH